MVLCSETFVVEHNALNSKYLYWPYTIPMVGRLFRLGPNAMHNAPLTTQAKRSFLLLDDTEFGSGFAWLASRLQIVCPSDSSCSYHAYDFDLAGRPNDNHPLRGWNGKNTPSMEETVAVVV